MALVFPHTGPDLSSHRGIVGKFLGDGLEYLACIRDHRFIDFYLFPECYFKCKTIEVLEKNSQYGIEELVLYNISSTLDYLVMILHAKDYKLLSKCEFTPYIYFDTKEVRDLPGGHSYHDMHFPSRNLAPGLFISKGNKVHKGNKVVLEDNHPLTGPRGYILDEDRFVFLRQTTAYSCEYIMYIFSLQRNQVISAWGPVWLNNNRQFKECFSYLSRDDKFRIIAISSGCKIAVLDISQPLAVDISDQFNTNIDCSSDAPEFLFYDKDTGYPVFSFASSDSAEMSLAFYSETGFSSTIFRNADFLNERFIIYGSDAYEIVINSAKELEVVYKTSIPVMERIEHTYRDLAWAVYFDVNGVFRKSLTFTTSGVLSDESVEPVTNVFRVGKESVLISGKVSSVVVDIQTAKELDSWYKPEETLFACENFQVYKAQGKSWLCTKDEEIELPFADASLFASSGDDIVVGSTTRVAVIAKDLKTSRVQESHSIISVFSEGYVCESGVKFFKTPERDVQANVLFSAQLVDDDLFTTSIDGELRSGENQERVDLMLEELYSISAFDDQMLILASNDTYIYSKGDYLSIEAGDYEEILVSSDNQVCVTLSEGIVYCKTRAGFQHVKKKIGGERDYSQVSVFNDKLMCVRENSSQSTNELIVKEIAGNVTNCFRKPNDGKKNNYVLCSETHFLEFCLSESNIRISMLHNPEETVYEHLPGTCFNVRTLPIYPCNNKLFVSSEDYGVRYNSVVFQLENGTFNCCGCEYYETVDFAEDDSEVEDSDRPYNLGSQVSDYPRSGDHWIVYQRTMQLGEWQFNLIPKSQKYIQLNVYDAIIPLLKNECDSISCICSENDPNVYYCASANKVYRVSTNVTQETIATINNGVNELYRFSAKYTANHGSKIKFELDFIITNGYPTTVTILCPPEAEKLQALQKELISDSKDANVVSEIDGRFLLSAAMDPKNEDIFTKHGIDIDRFKKDLYELFK